MPPDRHSEENQVRGLFELLSEHEMLPENLTGLEQVLAQNRGDVQVVIVEMPVPPSYLHFFGNGQQDCQRFIDRVESIAKSRAIQFWQTTQLRLILADDWFDYCYL